MLPFKYRRKRRKRKISRRRVRTQKQNANKCLGASNRTRRRRFTSLGGHRDGGLSRPTILKIKPDNYQIQEDWNTNTKITVTDCLKNGAHGEIFKAKYGNQECVMKYMPKTKESILHYTNEISCLTKLQDNTLFPNLYGHGYTTKAYYLFISFYTNGDLRDFLHHEIGAEHTSSQAEMMTIYAADILLAIEHMHSKKILHLDLKLENIVLSDDKSHVIIIDFGLAKMKMTDDLIKSEPTTEKYTAPEVYKTTQCGEPADLWSFGVILYVLFERIFPFDDRDKIINTTYSAPYIFFFYYSTKDIIPNRTSHCQTGQGAFFL